MRCGSQIPLTQTIPHQTVSWLTPSPLTTADDGGLNQTVSLTANTLNGRGVPWPHCPKKKTLKPSKPTHHLLLPYLHRQVQDRHSLLPKVFEHCRAHHRQSHRTFKCRVVREHPLDHHIPGLSTNMVVQAIKARSNSKATGPDGLTMLHIKHLGPRGISFLTHLYTLSLKSANIPSIWKQTIIIAILKVGEPRYLGSSYRPFSLICPGVKYFYSHNSPITFGWRIPSTACNAPPPQLCCYWSIRWQKDSTDTNLLTVM